MPVKRYNGTAWEVIAGDGVVGAPGTPGTNGTNGIDAGMTLLSTTTLSGTSTAITGISQAYNHLFVTIENAAHSTTGVYWNFDIDGLSFRTFQNSVHGTTKYETQATGTPSIAQDEAGGIYGYVWIYNYASASRIRHYALNTRYSTSEGNAARWATGTTTSTTAIDAITIDANGSTMSGGTIRVYGVK
jgi:hypothetical protein